MQARLAAAETDAASSQSSIYALKEQHQHAILSLQQHVDQLQGRFAESQAECSSLQAAIQDLHVEQAAAAAASVEKEHSHVHLVQQLENQLAEAATNLASSQSSSQVLQQELEQEQMNTRAALASSESHQQELQHVLARHAAESAGPQQSQPDNAASTSSDLAALEQRLADQSSKHQKKTKLLIEKHASEVSDLRNKLSSAGLSSSPAAADSMAGAPHEAAQLSDHQQNQASEEAHLSEVGHLEQRLEAQTASLEDAAAPLQASAAAQDDLRKQCLQLEGIVMQQKAAVEAAQASASAAAESMSERLQAVQSQLGSAQAARMQVEALFPSPVVW